jgi:RNA polymerase sigma-70 factor (ECF subfamily)
MNNPDSILITRVILGNDHKAFKILVERYQSDLRGLFLRLTHGNKDISDDLAQETFVRVYKYLTGFKATSKFKTWLFRIGYNVFYEYCKKNKTTRLEPDSYETEYETFEPGCNIDFTNSLKVLNQNEKSVIILHYEKGFTHKEISKITNQPLGTVKTNILRGKEKLKKFYSYER